MRDWPATRDEFENEDGAGFCTRARWLVEVGGQSQALNSMWNFIKSSFLDDLPENTINLLRKPVNMDCYLVSYPHSVERQK